MSKNLVKNIINSIQKLKENYKKSVLKLVSSCEALSNEIRNIRIEYQFDSDLGFNFFTSISDFYYRENFHSDILKNILDPRTQVIGDKKYLDEFLELLRKANNKIEIPSFNSKTRVEREKGNKKGYVDLLIYDDENAIIIENKINNAPDTENQLGKYVKYVKEEMDLNVVAIVYLILTPGKYPNLNYDDDYIEYVSEIKEKLIILSAINTKNQMDLSHDYFKTNEKEIENATSKVYFKEYMRLLKYLGGRIMTRELEKEMVKELFLDIERIKTIKEMVNVWENRSSLLSELIMDLIITKNNYFKHNVLYNNEILKKIDNDVSIGIGYDDGAKDFPLYYGFVNNGKNSEKLEKILQNNFFDYNSKVEIKSNQYWIWRSLEINFKTDDMDMGRIIKYSEEIYENLNELERLYKDKKE